MSAAGPSEGTRPPGGTTQSDAGGQHPSAIEVRVPDIGDFHDIPVIEVLVAPGERIEEDAPLVTLESDKATMEVPSPQAGTVRSIAIRVGDKVSEGTPLLILEAAEGAPDAGRAAAKAAPAAVPESANGAAQRSEAGAVSARPADAADAAGAAGDAGRDLAQRPALATSNHAAGPESHPIARPNRGDGAAKPHASPGVRKYARKLGVDLARVSGSGPKERIVVDDVQAFVRAALGGASAVPATSASRGPMAPASDGVVRHEGEADITALEAFRRGAAPRHEADSGEPPLVAFVVKAAAVALAQARNGAASRAGDAAPSPATIAVAVTSGAPRADEPAVIRAADVKGIAQIAEDLAPEVGNATPTLKATTDAPPLLVRTVERLDATLPPAALASWLAVVDVGPVTTKPVWDGAAFAPRSVLPLAVWSEPRALDAAAAVSFLARLVAVLADLRRAIL